MAKFNIEVELDWVDGEDGYTIDEEIKEQVVSGIKDALLKKATTEAVEAVDDKIAEKILEAEGTIQATVDQFVANVCEEKIGKIIIPEKKNTWSEGIKAVLTDVLEALKGVIDTFLGWFGTDLDTVWSEITSTVESVWNGIVDFFACIT